MQEKCETRTHSPKANMPKPDPLPAEGKYKSYSFAVEKEETQHTAGIIRPLLSACLCLSFYTDKLISTQECSGHFDMSF